MPLAPASTPLSSRLPAPAISSVHVSTTSVCHRPLLKLMERDLTLRSALSPILSLRRSKDLAPAITNWKTQYRQRSAITSVFRSRPGALVESQIIIRTWRSLPTSSSQVPLTTATFTQMCVLTPSPIRPRATLSSRVSETSRGPLISQRTRLVLETTTPSFQRLARPNHSLVVPRRLSQTSTMVCRPLASILQRTHLRRPLGRSRRNTSRRSRKMMRLLASAQVLTHPST